MNEGPRLFIRTVGECCSSRFFLRKTTLSGLAAPFIVAPIQTLFNLMVLQTRSKNLHLLTRCLALPSNASFFLQPAASFQAFRR